MWAKLIVKGANTNIYVLHKDNGKCEVEAFFDKNPAIRDGFLHYLNKIADDGLEELTREQFDCWRESGKRKGELFCELKKNPYRIGCFRYGERLLLVNVFRKKGDKETSHYQKAVRLKKIFDRKPEWRR